MKITENGTHFIKSKSFINASKSIVYLTGVTGGATCTLGFLVNGTFNAYTDGVIASPSVNEITHGFGVQVYLEVTGVTGTTDLEVNITGVS